MTLLAPLGLLFLLAVPILVLFYLLRVRFREREVGSTYLWERLARDLAAQDPWQKPHFTLLMLVQILLLAFLALALARPAALALAQERVFQVIVLDGSASMQATDVAPNRFAEAQRLATEAIRSLPDGSNVAVILAGRRPTVLVPATQDTGRALTALDAAQAGSTTLDLSAALRLAGALAAGRSGAVIDVFTDGAFAPPTDLAPLPAPVRYHLTGGGANNLAVTDIAARAETTNNRGYQVFVRVRNYGPQAATTLGLYTNGRLFDSRSLHLAPGGQQDLLFDRLPADTTLVEARLLGGDDLALDDSAATVLARPHPTRILLVTADNVFLQRGLSLLPDVELYRVTPSHYGDVDERQYDVVVFDGFLPPSLPRQNLLVVNPPDSPLLPVQGSQERPKITSWETQDPLLRYVSFADVRLQHMAVVMAPGWAKTLVTASDHPLIMSGEQDGQRFVILTFDLQQSNLPLNAGFPILLANALGYLEPPDVLQERTITAGEALTIQPLPQADEVTVVQPSGSSVSLTPEHTVRFDQTNKIGIYTVRQSAHGKTISEERFAVNLADAGESDVSPRQPEAAPVAASALDESQQPVQRETWPWLVLAGIGLLTGEWWLYHRRA